MLEWFCFDEQAFLHLDFMIYTSKSIDYVPEMALYFIQIIINKYCFIVQNHAPV